MIELTFRNRGKISDMVYHYLDMQKLRADTVIVYGFPETYFFEEGCDDCTFYVDTSKFCHLTTSFVNELTSFFSLNKHDALYILFMWMMNRYNIRVRDYAINMK